LLKERFHIRHFLRSLFDGKLVTEPPTIGTANIERGEAPHWGHDRCSISADDLHIVLSDNDRFDTGSEDFDKCTALSPAVPAFRRVWSYRCC